MDYLEEFKKAPLCPEDISELNIRQNDLLKDGSFSSHLTFGTGGVRQIYGLGTNRINIYNIARLILATIYILKHKNNKDSLHVIIGYDSRCSNIDLVPLSYTLLSSKNIKLSIFDEVVPTPLVSFAIPILQADCGIIFTASHNPPIYNGFKLYDHTGGQITSPLDKEIQKKYESILYKSLPTFLALPLSKEIPQSCQIQLSSILSLYTNSLITSRLVSNSLKKVSILYSPLHGTGTTSFAYLFEKCSFQNAEILEEQKQPDGNFPTIKFPNPEEKEAFDLLQKKALSQKTDILLATDPDADRLGVMLYNKREENYVLLTGNQIGAVLLYILGTNYKQNRKNPFFCKTIVTSELQRKIADSLQIKTVETLTGFKYIAKELQKDPNNFLFGAEESYGYLPITWVRDKDSLSTAMILCEYADKHNPLELLDELYYQFGYYFEKIYSITLPENALEQQEHWFNTIYHSSELFLENYIGNRKIIDVLNLQNPSIIPKTKYVQQLKQSLDSSTVLQYYLEPEGRVTIRPSGTEPKIKIYISLKSKELPIKNTLQKIKISLTDEANEMYNTVSSRFI